MTAVEIDSVLRWSTQLNPLVADDKIPYATVLGDGADAFDVFTVTVGTGAELTADIDFGNCDLVSPTFHSIPRLLDADGNQLTFNDESASLDLGSERESFGFSFVAFLKWTNTSTEVQTFLSIVRFFGGSDTVFG